MDRIKRVYLGLPYSLVDAVLWVSRKYRTNPLSHEPGGSDVVVEYHNENVFGYDWIKKPSRYVSAIWSKGISEIHEDYEEWEEEDQLEEIKKEIRSIYARKYLRKEDFDKIPFKEIWNSETSDHLPWVLLEDYDHKNYNRTYGYCQNCNKKLSGDKSKKLCYKCWTSKPAPKSNHGLCNNCGKKLRGDKSKKLCYKCWSSKNKKY